MDMEQGKREMTFDEEYEILQTEKEMIFAKEIDGCEPPFVNCVLRRALRCIRKLLAKNKIYEDLLEKSAEEIENVYGMETELSGEIRSVLN